MGSAFLRIITGVLFVLIAAGSSAQGRTNTLPVMFDSVRISMKSNGILVEWTNLTERELLEYIVERSADARQFTPVARVKPRSNINEAESYDELDAAPLTGVSYYRIRVNEQTGKIIYSIILKIETGVKDRILAVYPNPCSTGQLGWSEANLPAGSYRLGLIGMQGQCVYSKEVKLTGKACTGSIALPPGTGPGVYQFHLQGDGVDMVKSFIIQ